MASDKGTGVLADDSLFEGEDPEFCYEIPGIWDRPHEVNDTQSRPPGIPDKTSILDLQSGQTRSQSININVEAASHLPSHNGIHPHGVYTNESQFVDHYGQLREDNVAIQCSIDITIPQVESDVQQIRPNRQTQEKVSSRPGEGDGISLKIEGEPQEMDFSQRLTSVDNANQQTSDIIVINSPEQKSNKENGGNQHATHREARSLIAQMLVDIEDVGTVTDRATEHRPRGLYVTDFSSSEWCQQQVAFALSAALPEGMVETAAMRSGKERHAILEAETALDQVTVEVETREDRFALRLINMAQGLKQLMLEGITRELMIFGILQGQFVRGIVDQLSYDSLGEVQVVEQKTRFQPSLPGICQKRTTALQMMIYRTLLEGLPNLLTGDPAKEFLKSRDVNAHKTLSQVISDHACIAGLPAKNLLELCAQLRSATQALPPLSNELLVNYIWQGDGELLEQEKVQMDHQFVNSAIEKHLDFWKGVSAPQKLEAAEQWKCERCNFRAKCWPETFRKVPWQH